MIMRDTVYCLAARTPTQDAIARLGRGDGRPRSQAYVPGYRLKQEVQFERFGAEQRR